MYSTSLETAIQILNKEIFGKSIKAMRYGTNDSIHDSKRLDVAWKTAAENWLHG